MSHLTIEPGTRPDIEELAQLYDDLNDYLANNTNYPGWIKGVYPVRENAVKGIAEQTLHVAREPGGRIAGSLILNHHPEPAYHGVAWGVEADYADIGVIHTFVVHPDFLKAGVGTALMEFAAQSSIRAQWKAIRLDVYQNNLPAIRLYEKMGYTYVATVDLNLGHYGLDWFKLYEKLL